MGAPLSYGLSKLISNLPENNPEYESSALQFGLWMGMVFGSVFAIGEMLECLGRGNEKLPWEEAKYIDGKIEELK